MELPEFNGSGTGPQGTGGIPPEEIRQGLRGDGAALIESQIQPEDSPAAQRVLSRAVDTVMADLGLHPDPTPQQQPAAPAQPDTPQNIPPAAAEPSPTRATDPMAERIAAIRAKYPNNDELAKAYLHTDAARTRAQQERNGDIAELREGFNTLSRSVMRLAEVLPAGGGGYQPAQPGRAAQPEANAAPITAEAFFQDPLTHIQTAVDRSVQQNLLAFQEAQRRQTAEQKLVDFQRQHQDEIAQLRPVMREIYATRQHLYEGLSQDAIMDDLLERARDKAAARQLAETNQMLMDPTWPGNLPSASVPSPGPGAAGLNSGGGGARPVNGGVTDWSNTPAMQRLWRSRDGGVNENAAITDILKERGFGDHIV